VIRKVTNNEFQTSDWNIPLYSLYVSKQNMDTKNYTSLLMELIIYLTLQLKKIGHPRD
jgi:hypothetical protein